MESQTLDKEPKVPLAQLNTGEADNTEEWEFVKARSRRRRRKNPPSKPEVPLQNRFMTLQKDKGEKKEIDTLEQGKTARSGPRITTSVIKEKQWVIVVGDSLLRGTEASIC